MEALAICAAFTDFGAYPRDCANFDQLGFRVPFIAVSPFSRPPMCRIRWGDHTSMLALIEERFLSTHHGFSRIASVADRGARKRRPAAGHVRFPEFAVAQYAGDDRAASDPTDPGCPLCRMAAGMMA